MSDYVREMAEKALYMVRRGMGVQGSAAEAVESVIRDVIERCAQEAERSFGTDPGLHPIAVWVQADITARIRSLATPPKGGPGR